MSRLGLNTAMLARCVNTWAKSAPVAVAPLGTTLFCAPLCQRTVRQVSTTKAKKAQAPKDDLKEATPPLVSKQSASKTKAASTASKSRKVSSKAADAVPDTPPPRTTKSVAGTKTVKTTKQKAAASAAENTTSAAKSTPAPPPTPQAAAATVSTPTAHKPESAPPVAPKATAPISANTTAQPKPRVDPSSPEYKEAARKWVLCMIAMPILIVSSYVLYERLVLGKTQHLEEMDKYRRRMRDAVAIYAAETPDDNTK